MSASPDDGAVAYAQAYYGVDGVEFWNASATPLAVIEESAFDAVMICIDNATGGAVIESLDECRRVLRPDGRLILAVRGAAHWNEVIAHVGQKFILEARHVQEPRGGRLRRADLKARGEGEWSLLIASANPLDAGPARRGAFRHPAFDAAFSASGAAVVDFRAGYDNPYLYRAMVQMGERLADDGALMRLALWVADHARPGSADRGAALCVLAYRALEARNAGAATEALDLIADYRRATEAVSDNAHVLRWRLSLAFVAARLSELIGDRVAAASHYRAVDGSWDRFSPLLATKSVAAAFLEGRLHLASGDMAAARGCFSRGLREALRALRCDPGSFVGDPEAPVPFAMQELAEVIDMGSQCANAIAHIGLYARDPGLFWRQVDVRRFGLASWARDVERENAALREENLQLRRASR